VRSLARSLAIYLAESDADISGNNFRVRVRWTLTVK